MYKFLLYCPEPPAKKTKTSEEKLEGQRKYEKENRKRTFLPRWEKEFTWLKNTEKGMVCVIFAVKMNTLDHLLLDVMISKMHYSVYYNNRTEKLLKLEPKKIQKSDENVRAELTHILLTRQHNA
jgi:hypothetical protein